MFWCKKGNNACGNTHLAIYIKKKKKNCLASLIGALRNPNLGKVPKAPLLRHPDSRGNPEIITSKSLKAIRSQSCPCSSCRWFWGWFAPPFLHVRINQLLQCSCLFALNSKPYSKVPCAKLDAPCPHQPCWPPKTVQCP